VRCATFFDTASTFLNNDATVAEESAARPRLLPARERKSRRVRTCAHTNQSGSGGGMQSLSSRAEEGRSGKKVEVRIKKFATANGAAMDACDIDGRSREAETSGERVSQSVRWRRRRKKRIADCGMTRDLPIARSPHHATNAVYPAASPHAVLRIAERGKSNIHLKSLSNSLCVPIQTHSMISPSR
jgi:hypothetical protein